MNIEQLEFITETFRCGSFSTAAARLHVSQPGISQAVALLEKELNITLFKRSKKGAEPTVEGYQILKKAEDIIYHIHELKTMAKLQNCLQNETIKVSVIPSIFPTALIKSFVAFKNAFPGVKVELHEKQVQEVVIDVVNNDADIGLIAIYHENWLNLDGTCIEFLFEGKIGIAVSKKSKLASKEFVTPDDIKHEPFAIYNGDNIQSFFKDFGEKHGPLNLLFSSNNTMTILNAVIEGLAISVLPNNPLLAKHDDFIIIPLKSHEPTNIRYCWIHNKQKPVAVVVSEFKKYVGKSIPPFNAL